MTHNAKTKYQLFFLILLASISLLSTKAFAALSSVALEPAGVRFSGEQRSDRAGMSVQAIGDVNCDGYDDLMIGTPYQSDLATYIGRAYVIFGPSPSTIGLGSANVQIDGTATYDYLGWSLAGVGDVNGDGCDDILIGAPYSYDAAVRAGAAYLIYGKSGLADMTTATADVKYVGISSGDYAGYSVAAAEDVNADGYADFIIGAPGRDSSTTDTGAAYLIYGSNALSSMALSAADVRFWGEASGDQAGLAVSSAGDFNGDGYSDLLISASGDDTKANNAGAAYLIFGQNSHLRRVTYLSSADTKFLGEAANDFAGSALASAGDMDGDGIDDIIISAPYNDGKTALLANRGAVYLFKGTTSALAAKISLSDSIGTIYGKKGLQYFGKSVSTAGDFNADGYADIIVGAYTNSDFHASSGAAFILYGRSVLPIDDTTDAMDLEYMGGALYDYAGYAVGGGSDFDNDGFDDVLIGATGQDTGGNSAGAVYLLYGF